MSSTVEQYDLSEQRFWQLAPEARLEYFRHLREHDPISWHGGKDSPGGRGFWAIVRHEDVRRVSRDSATFSSASGIAILDQDPGEAAVGVQVPSFLALDDPEHARLRGIVQQAFSVKQVKRIEDQIRADARAVVGDLDSGETGDFIERVAKRLPSLTIARMLGVPDADREAMLEHVETLVSFQDPDFCQGRDPNALAMEAVIAMGTHAYEMAQHRRAHPQDDDLITALVQAENDGERLTDAEITAFMILLAVAGNDTTRTTTSHAMKALTDFPAQRALLLDDLGGRLPVAVDEFVRWATPVVHFMRTAVEDAEVGGRPVAAGEAVAMFYSSANRDERAFDEPDRFDVTRSPNRHVGFGGGGIHFCMGAMLARAQLRAIFDELLSAFPQLSVGEPDYLTGTVLNAIRALPMDAGPRA